MEVVKLQCASCGAPIQVPADLDTFNCAYCGTPLTVRRGEGYVALQVAEMARAVAESGTQTQSVIREELEATREQLRKLELSQQLGVAQARLYTVQSDIRVLDRQKKRTRSEKRELRDLQGVELRLVTEIRQLEQALHPASGDEGLHPTPRQRGSGCQMVAVGVLLLVACSFVWMALAVVGCHPVLALIAASILMVIFAARYYSRRAAPTQ